MKELLKIYQREVIGLFLLVFIFSLSSYLVTKEYARWRQNKYLEKHLKQELSLVREVYRQLEIYARYPFWRRLGTPQEVRIYEKLGLRPLEETVYKLSDLYVERGFFFLERLELETCEGRKGRPSRKVGPCKAHLYVAGKKVVF